MYYAIPQKDYTAGEAELVDRRLLDRLLSFFKTHRTDDSDSAYILAFTEEGDHEYAEYCRNIARFGGIPMSYTKFKEKGLTSYHVTCKMPTLLEATVFAVSREHALELGKQLADNGEMTEVVGAEAQLELHHWAAEAK